MTSMPEPPKIPPHFSLPATTYLALWAKLQNATFVSLASGVVARQCSDPLA